MVKSAKQLRERIAVRQAGVNVKEDAFSVHGSQ